MHVPRGSSVYLCHVPLFQSVTWRYPRPVREFDIGYIMGLVVGEGSFTADRQQPFLQVKLHVRDPFPLRYLADRLGGRVYGPYRHQTRHYYTWLLRGPDLRAAVPLFRDYLPESWRREQFERWLQSHAAFFALERTERSPELINDAER